MIHLYMQLESIKVIINEDDYKIEMKLKKWD